MLLLAFDTATPTVTVAVHDGQQVIGRASGATPMAHGEQLAPAIAGAMEQANRPMADLTDVAVGVGPGPFTGLRVGVATALTLASTLQIRRHGRCTLDIIAAAITEPEPFVVATDARRKELYWARYEAGQRIGLPKVDRPDVIAELGLPVYGPGAELYGALLGHLSHDVAGPRAETLAHMVVAERFESLQLEPLYLRRPDATVSQQVKLA